jgi:hypothetical protein
VVVGARQLRPARTSDVYPDCEACGTARTTALGQLLGKVPAKAYTASYAPHRRDPVCTDSVMPSFVHYTCALTHMPLAPERCLCQEHPSHASDACHPCPTAVPHRRMTRLMKPTDVAADAASPALAK